MKLIKDFAEKILGNYTRIPNYADYSDYDPRYWTMLHLSHRDSDVLTLSNAATIRQELESLDTDTDIEFSSVLHWAVGYCDVVYIRVYDTSGEITRAFAKYFELQERLADYPVLNDDDYNARQEAYAQETWKYISDKERAELKKRFNIPARLRSYHSVMRADNGGLYEYLTLDS